MFDIKLKVTFNRDVNNVELQGFCDELTGALFVKKRILHVSFTRKKGDIFLLIRVDVSKKIIKSIVKIIFQVFTDILHPETVDIVFIKKIDVNSRIKVIIKEKGDVKCQN